MWLDLDGSGPLYLQTYRSLREAILAGELAAGSRVPSTRGLAGAAGVSRTTVLQAYDQLVAEGYLEPRRGSGTFVAATVPDEHLRAGARTSETSPAPGPTSPPPLSAYARRLLRAGHAVGMGWDSRAPRLTYDFRYGGPAYDELPLEDWARALGRQARGLRPRDLAYGRPGGSPELREALAEYLYRGRGVRCRPEQVIVTYGAQQAIDLVTRVVLDPGSRAVVEDPVYPGFTVALEALGANIDHVPCDDTGIDVSRIRSGEDLRLICVTPSHQFPSGSTLSLDRRLELLSLAQGSGAFVLEDDYDSEYRYSGRPLACMQSLDESGRVIYLGTASKLLYPALRIAWLVAPESLRRPLLAAKAICDTGTAGIEQAVLARFIRDGSLERHVRRTRGRNASRRRTLIEAVENSFGHTAEVTGAAAGLHVVLWLNEVKAREAERLRALAASRDVGVYPVAPYYAEPPARCGFVIGYSSLAEDAIAEGIARLAAAANDLALK